MKRNGHLYQVLESIQYGIFYMVLAFLGGVGLDFVFPPFSDKTDTDILFLEVTGQCLSLIIVVYVIRYWIQSIPLLFPVRSGSGYIPYSSAEFNGEMMMGMVFISSQLNLLYKIDLISKRLYAFFFEEERAIESLEKKLSKKN
jgi:hypothetical protein